MADEDNVRKRCHAIVNLSGGGNLRHVVDLWEKLDHEANELVARYRPAIDALALELANGGWRRIDQRRIDELISRSRRRRAAS